MTMTRKRKSYIYRVLTSPFEEDEPLPWDYEEDGFISWVDEVFLEGYKDDDEPLPTVGECIDILEGSGYEVEVIEQ
jgi:hypothetical protein